jgi:hypothetical protein
LAGSNTPDVSTDPLASSSITELGGTRPPVPTTVVGGSDTPLWTNVTIGESISVIVRLVEVLDGRNSVTVPETVIESPTARPRRQG